MTPTVKSIRRKIETQARKRTANWNRPDTNPQVTFDTTARLAELWTEMRQERSRRKHGSRELIVRQARIERELERLMTRNEHVGS